MKQPFRPVLLLLVLTSLFLSGCRQLEVKLPGGASLKSKSFGNKLSVGEIAVSTNGTVTVRNYNLDQVQGLGVVVEGAVKGAVEGLK